jgi:hypothetical protein
MGTTTGGTIKKGLRGKEVNLAGQTLLTHLLKQPTPPGVTLYPEREDEFFYGIRRSLLPHDRKI